MKWRTMTWYDVTIALTYPAVLRPIIYSFLNSVVQVGVVADLMPLLGGGHLAGIRFANAILGSVSSSSRLYHIRLHASYLCRYFSFLRRLPEGYSAGRVEVQGYYG